MKDKIKILYKNREYNLNKQQLNEIIAISSEQIRKKSLNNLNGGVSLEIFSIFRGMQKEAIQVFIKDFDSELYGQMGSEIIYAIEKGLLDNFEKKKVKKEKPAMVQVPIIMKLPRIKICSEMNFDSVWNFNL